MRRSIHRLHGRDRAKPAKILHPRRAHKRVLVGDDDERTRQMVSAVLKRSGFVADLCENGREGLDRLASAHLRGDHPESRSTRPAWRCRPPARTEIERATDVCRGDLGRPSWRVLRITTFRQRSYHRVAPRIRGRRERGSWCWQAPLLLRNNVSFAATRCRRCRPGVRRRQAPWITFVATRIGHAA